MPIDSFTDLPAALEAIVMRCLEKEPGDRPQQATDLVRGLDTLATGEYVAVGAALVAAMLSVYLVLRFAGQVRRLLRESGAMLLTRIAGLLLSAIAVQMVADAVRAVRLAGGGGLG